MQQLNPSEISELIRQRIERLEVAAEAQDEGTIVSVSDGIVRIHGLRNVMYGEMIAFEGGLYGMALNLERDSVGAVILGDYLKLAEGQKARCTGRILEVPIGPELEGRVVDALGNPTSFVLTAGQASDLDGADVLLKGIDAQMVIADKAYDAQQRVVDPLLKAGKAVVIPSIRTRAVQREYDRHLYKARHLIENFFARLKQYRAIATRYDKTAIAFLGSIHLAATVVWLI